VHVKAALIVLVAALLLPYQTTGQTTVVPYTIDSIAGVGPVLGDGGPATSAQLFMPAGLAVDKTGILYISDIANYRIRKVSAAGAITTLTGNGVRALSGDRGPAANAQITEVYGMALDKDGNLYFADLASSRVRKIATDGIISTIAGGKNGFSGDGGPATAAQLNRPYSVAVDGSGNIYIADTYNYRIRKISADGTITTAAGTGTRGHTGDDGPAQNAQIMGVVALAMDAAGNLYFPEPSGNRVRKVDTSGVIRTIAGTGEEGFNGDDRPATTAQLSQPTGVGVDSAGNVYIADSQNGRIRKVTPAGLITTVAGGGDNYFPQDGNLATDAGLPPLQGLLVDSAGNIYFTDQFTGLVRKVTTDGRIRAVAGGSHFSGDGDAATKASLFFPEGVAAGGDGTLLIADTHNNRVRKVTAAGQISTVAAAPQVLVPAAVAADHSGNFYVTDSGAGQVLKISSGGGLSVVAGGGDGGPAAQVELELSVPGGLAVDAAGNLFIVESDHSRVLKLTPGGTITTFAGTGESGFSGDGGPASSALMNLPLGVAVDNAGDLYIADAGNARIRKVGGDGIIRTVAGGGQQSPENGVPATEAALCGVASVAADSKGSFYFGNRCNNAVWMVSSTGALNLFAGTREAGFAGDGGLATQAKLWSPDALAVDKDGNLVIADTYNHRIRKLAPTAGPALASNGLANAASFAAGAAPEAWVSAFGSNLAPGLVVADAIPLPASLDGTSVKVTDSAGTERAAPLQFVSPNQVNFLVPADTRTGEAKVTITVADGRSALATMPLDFVNPGIFSANSSGKDVASALAVRVDAAGQQSIVDVFQCGTTGGCTAKPIDLGPATDQVILELFGTGIRGYRSGVAATIGGQTAEVLAAVAQGQFAGLDQVNVRIPRTLVGRGEVPIVLTVDGKAANQVTVNIGGTVPPLLPQIVSVEPSAALAGQTIQSFSITGQNLAGVTAVVFSPATGITVTNVAATATLVTARVAIAADATPGSRSLSVISPAGASSTLSFTVQAATPQITALNPTVGDTGQTVSTFTVSGTNLAGSTAVEFAPSADITVSNVTSASTIVTARVVIAAGAATGSRSVSVVSPAGRSNALSFTVRQGVPQITSVTPANGITGQTSGAISITGQNLNGATAIEFSPSVGMTVSNLAATSTTVTAQVTISSSASIGARTITVVTPAGRSNALSYEVKPPAPQLTALSPDHGQQEQIIVHFTLSGTNLTGVSAIEFSPSDDVIVSNLSSTATTVTADLAIAYKASTGTRSVTVVTPGGRSNVLPFNVTLLPDPRISSVAISPPIPGTSGNTASFSGSLYFTDHDGDIRYVSGDVGSAKVRQTAVGVSPPCVMESFGTFLDKPGQTAGTLIWRTPQIPYTRKITSPRPNIAVSLIDAAGHESNVVNVQLDAWYCMQ
jgi:trimeric autotransporter adhesin